MEAKALAPRELFDGNVCFEIPAFQRPYVWNEEDQWQPLWDDLERLAAELTELEGSAVDANQLPSHFLGAVVVKQLPNPAGDPSRFSVIDGQQRLTTLQVLLDAAQLVLLEHGSQDDAESLEELVLNTGKRFRGTSKRFKLWPSRVDRHAFEHVMDNALEVLPEIAESRIAQAHGFFLQAINNWADLAGGSDKAQARLASLAQVLQERLKIVSISLGGNDDDQLIFETLNARGTPFLAADHIKNYVFQSAEDVGADIDVWSDRYWRDLDEDWWREQVAQGRLYRSRIDLFLQYWLTMRLQDEVGVDDVFSRFRSYAREHFTTRDTAEAFLGEMRRDADTFRDFAHMDPSSVRGRFYARVVEALETGAAIPVLLWLISDNHHIPAREVDKALGALESWVVRRTLLRLTMKDVNRTIVAMLKSVAKATSSSAGDAIVTFLRDQDADARAWPTDEVVIEHLPTVRAYGQIRQTRLRTVLAAIEQHWRTDRHEDVPLPASLEVEHVMPQQWRQHWGDATTTDAQAAAQRDHTVDTLGNLTLVNQKLNGTLSNRPWTDQEMVGLPSSGKHAGKGKRSLLGQYSLLVLNKRVVDEHGEKWTEDDIRARGAELAQAVVQIWPR